MLITKIVPLDLPFMYNYIGDVLVPISGENDDGDIYYTYESKGENAVGIKLSIQVATGRFISTEVKQEKFMESERDLAYIVKVERHTLNGLTFDNGDIIQVTTSIPGNDEVEGINPSVQQKLEILNYSINGYHIEFRAIPLNV